MPQMAMIFSPWCTSLSCMKPSDTKHERTKADRRKKKHRLLKVSPASLPLKKESRQAPIDSVPLWIQTARSQEIGTAAHGPAENRKQLNAEAAYRIGRFHIADARRKRDGNAGYSRSV